MQKIERYGVIALVFLLVTILAISLWGESKDGGLFPWSKSEPKEVAKVDGERPRPRLGAAQQRNAQLAAQRANQEGGAQAGAQGGALGGPRPAGGLELSQPAADSLANRPTPGASLQRPLITPTILATEPVAAQPIGGAPATAELEPQLPVGPNTILRGAQPNLAPATQPLTQPAPSRSTRTYVVKSGDTLGEIARRELGTTARWPEIQALNGNLDPKRLRQGMKLTLPVGAATARVDAASPVRAAGAVAANGGRYAIRNGDTLSGIAASQLGDAGRWNELVALNPGLDPERLRVGAVLVLPGAGSRPVASTPRAAAVDSSRVVAFGTPPSGKSKVQ